MKSWRFCAVLVLCTQGNAVAQRSIDANLASLAEVERIKGVGTTVAASILSERDKGAFKDWSDLIRRVKGVGASNAARLSAEGLTVNGAAFSIQGAPPAAAKAVEAKPGN